MKKLLLFVIACTLGLFGTVSAQEQEYVIVGDGSTSSQNVPIKADYEYSLTQQIYLQGEIGTGAGTITSIGFQGTSNLTKSNVTIYMVNTDKSSFTSTNGDFIAMPESSKVYEGALGFKINDWNELTLQTPFNYTGGNLMLCVYDHTGTYVSISPAYKAFTATDSVMRTVGVFSYNKLASGFENGGTISGTSASFWDFSEAYQPGSIYVTRNQVRFGFIAGQGGGDEPTPLSLSISPEATTIYSNATATLTATANGGSGNYTYTWADAEGLTANGNTATFTPSELGEFTFTCTVNDGETTEEATATATITVKEAAVPEAPEYWAEAILPYSIYVGWDAVDGATGYNIHYTDGTNEYNVNNLTGSYHILNNLEAGTEYFITMTATNEFGDSDASMELSVITLAADQQYRIMSVSVPTNQYLNIFNHEGRQGPKGGVNLASYDESVSQIFTIEKANDGKVYFHAADGYYINVFEGWGVSAQFKTTTGDDEKKATALGLEFTDFYENPNDDEDIHNGSAKFHIAYNPYFKVEMVDGGYYPFANGEANVAEEWVLEFVEVPEAPSAPTGLQATVNGTSVTLNWNSVTGATSYNVYTNNGTPIETTEPTYTITDLNPATTYCFTVTAVNIGGESSPSDEVCVKTDEIKRYRIKSVDYEGKYLNIEQITQNNTGGKSGVNVAEYAESDMQIFTIEDAGNGNVYFRSASGYYINCLDGWMVSAHGTTTSSAAYLKMVDKGNNTFAIQCNDGYFKVEEVSGGVYPFSNGSSSEAALWTLEEVGSSNPDNPVEGCDVIFTLTDSGSDGWNGSYLEVSYNGTTKRMDLNTGSSTEYALTIPMSTVVTVAYYKGNNSWPEEVGFTIKYENGDIIKEIIPGVFGAYDENASFQFTVDCSAEIPETPETPETPDLTAMALNRSAIRLTWKEVEGATSYNIYNNSNDELVTEGITETTYTHEGLELDTEYCYYVKAVNDIGISDASNSACATTFDGSATIIGDEIMANDPENAMWYIPTNTKSTYSVSQQIYTSEVLGIDEACEINRISFFQSTKFTVTRDLEIYMQFSDKTSYDFDNENLFSTDWVNMKDSYKVFDGEYTFVEGECVITLEKEFLYIPGKSILITVVDKTGTALSDQVNFNVYQNEKSEYSSLYYYGEQYNASSLKGKWGQPLKRNNQIKLYYQISPAGILATPESLGFFFKSEGWSEKIEDSKNITIIKKNTDISSIVIEGDDYSFFNISSFDLNDNPIELEIGHGDLTAGQKTADLVITYNGGVKYIPLTASIYDPEMPDIWELAQEVDLSRGTYTHTPDFAKLHDDYILPKEKPEGNAPDAVYHITLQNEETVEVEVTGANGRYAIYSAADLADSGPSSSNVYRKVTPSFFYDFNDGNLEDFRMVEYDNNDSQWRISEGAGQDDSNTLVSYSFDGSNGASEADNYIITKNKYVINENSKLSFDVLCGGSWGGKWDNVMVKVSSDGEEFTLIETIDPKSTSWSSTTVNLGDMFATLGREYGNYYIALHHKTDGDIYDIKVDNLRLSDGSGEEQSGSSNSYPAGEYYLVAAAESEFTVNINVKSVPTPIFTGVGNWNDAEKWSTGTVPNANNIDVIIDGEASVSSDVTIRSVEINSGHSLTIASGSISVIGRIVNDDASAFVIEDGGQLIHTNEGVVATVKKGIAGYGNKDEKTLWHTISSPIANSIATDKVTNLTEGEYDLYYYDEPTHYWINHEDTQNNNGFNALESGRGYLYANKANVTLYFTGILNHDNTSFYLDNSSSYAGLQGINLIGNPYTHNIYKGEGSAIDNENLAEGYYSLSKEGKWGAIKSNDTPIAPCQSILVKTDVAGELAISKTHAAPAPSRAAYPSITIGVANERYSDEAHVLFKDGIGLNKVAHMNEYIPMLSVINDDDLYAIATMSEETEEIALRFEAMTMGQYTIYAKPQDGKFKQMVLTDMMNGTKTDLLNGSYTFMATTHDNPNRFVMTLSAEADSNADFIYINNGEMIISNIEGQGVLHIYDIMGRPVSEYDVNGFARISTGTFANGVYIVRLTDGNGVKTQKLMINN